RRPIGGSALWRQYPWVSFGLFCQCPLAHARLRHAEGHFACCCDQRCGGGHRILARLARTAKYRFLSRLRKIKAVAPWTKLLVSLHDRGFGGIRIAFI